MVSSESMQSKKKTSMGEQSHEHFLLLSLSRAAQAIQRARTPEDFYLAVGREINLLGGEVTLFLLTEDRQSLLIAYTSYSPTLIRKAEKLTGLTLHGYRLPLIHDGIYKRTLYGGTAVFIDSILEAMAEILPKAFHPFIGPLMAAFNLRQGALAPLRVDDEVLGLLKVNGSFLSVSDLPAMDSFAGHIAAGLYNVRLTQKLQDELTARREAEEALRASQSTFEGIFNSVTETIYIQDENGVFLDVNLGAEKMYGYPRQHFIGRTPEFLSAPGKNDLGKISGYLQQAFNGQPVEFEFWGIKKDGTVFPKDVRITSGSYFGRKVAIAVARDITERKRIESAFIRSEKAYRMLFENMPIGLYRTSVEGEIRNANPALLRMFGSSDAQSMLGRKAWDFYRNPATNDIFEELISKSGSLSAFEAEYTREDGTTFWAEDYVRIIHDENGVPEYYEGSLIDTTDRKQAEVKLKESEQRYRLLAERVADVVWVLDLTTKTFKYVSPSVQRLMGYSNDELNGVGLNMILTPASMARIEEIIPERIQRFLNGDEAAVTEVYQLDQIRKDGSVVSVEVSSTVVVNEKSELEEVGVTRDITQRKQAEDDIRRANISLQAAHRELQEMFEHEQVLARTDGLTHLYNRRYFFELATREFVLSKRYQRSLTVILFDIDGFKTANDTFGHALGDAILAQISQVARLQIREVDILARYGGDEFTILLPETNSEQAFITAERIRQSVADTHIDAGNASISVTLSLGVAEILHAQDRSIEDIIRRSDKALYQAKQKGKNHAAIFSPNE